MCDEGGSGRGSKGEWRGWQLRGEDETIGKREDACGKEQTCKDGRMGERG